MDDGVAVIADSNGKGYGFARGVYDYVKSREDRDYSVRLIDVEKTIFKDGEFKLRLGDNVRRSRCFYIHDPNKPASEWLSELAIMLRAIKFSSASEVNVVLPYTRFARQEIKDRSRVGVNARVVADIISMYADRGMTVDLHARQMQEYFNIPFDNLYSFPSLVNHLRKNEEEMLEDLVVVSPDLGGAPRAEGFNKRLKKNGIEADIAVGHKTRSEPNVVKDMLLIGNVEDKNCLVLDDIIDTGGTLVKMAELLRDRGAKRVCAYGTHGLFTDGYEKFRVFDKMFVSDSVYSDDFENLERVSLVKLFGEGVHRTILGKSLSSLFDGRRKNRDESENI